MHDHKKTNKFTNIERMLLPSDALGFYLHGPLPMATCLGWCASPLLYSLGHCLYSLVRSFSFSSVKTIRNAPHSVKY